MSEPLLTESAGWSRCVDCSAELAPGEPCVDLRDDTGDVICETCHEERTLS